MIQIQKHRLLESPNACWVCSGRAVLVFAWWDNSDAKRAGRRYACHEHLDEVDRLVHREAAA